MKILAVSSGGGHWVELLRLLPAFEGHETVLATVSRPYHEQVPNHRFYSIGDATRWDKWALVRIALRLAWILLRERPDVIVSTGAAPGYIAVRLGRLMRARTAWIDSIANVEVLSLSGQKVGPFADLWLTQWPHLARPGGPRYAGAVL